MEKRWLRKWLGYRVCLRPRDNSRRFRPSMEALEDRTLLATFTVVDTQDVGPGSLRQAIVDANASPGPDLVAFNIPGAGVRTIQPLSALPVVTDQVTIDGTSQPGFAGTPLIELDGASAGTAQHGLTITAGNSTVQGLIINRFGGSGILLRTNGANTIRGNYLGTNAAGTSGAANLAGVTVESTSPNNVIGGTAAGARNLISGNSNDGVHLASNGNRVEGNFIGTNAAGSAALANGRDGVQITGMNNLIGGTTVATRNIISGNVASNVRFGLDSRQNQVQGNYLGTDVTGQLALGGEYGVSAVFSAQNNLVGGTATGAGNLISGNRLYGVFLGGPQNQVQGNLIGTNASGTLALPNLAGIEVSGASSTIGGTVSGARNVISGNNGFGIFISTTGGGAQVQGNYVGTDITGTVALGNAETGIYVGGGSSTIGGTTPVARNLISGNRRHGVILANSGTFFQGNFIGTDVTGTRAIANLQRGLVVTDSFNRIGGDVAGAGNVISGNGTDGVFINVQDGSQNVYQGNLIGTDLTGTQPLPNSNIGIWVVGPGNTIGGNIPGARNIISGNGGSGILIQRNAFGLGGGNVVRGNYIGVDSAGTGPLGNAGHGVVLEAIGNFIGGTTSGAGNVISANGGSGIFLDPGNTTAGIQVQGNYIGTDATGTIARGNQQGGIVLLGGRSTIGGEVASARNVISGNIGNGLRVDGIAAFDRIEGNFIGTKVDGVSPLGNTANGIATITLAGTDIGRAVPGAGNIIAFNGADGITSVVGGPRIRGNTIHSNGRHGVSVLFGDTTRILRNAIFSNAGLGIDLGANGVTLNDPGDSDEGPNFLQNYPLITSVNILGGNTTIVGVLNSNPNVRFALEFFASNARDPSGFGEGELFIGSAVLTTPANGILNFTLTFPTVVPAGRFVTATATSWEETDTSEFSPAVLVANNLVQFSSTTYSATESATLTTVTVTRVGNTSAAATVRYATSNGTALAGADYQATTGTLTFAPGQTSATFSIPILDDSLIEDHETIHLTLSDPLDCGLGVPGTAVLTILENEPLALVVTSFTGNLSGFTVQFNQAVAVNVLNLYASASLGLADLVVVGNATGPVNASVVLDPLQQRLTFVRTGSILPPDTYTVTLRSAANGFKAQANGMQLDGDGDGTPGGNYVGTFVVLPSSTIVASVADFVGGPDQAVGVPGGAVGIPVHFSNARGFERCRIQVRFDPALLQITNVVAGPGFSSPPVVGFDVLGPGHILVFFDHFFSLDNGPRELIRLHGTVPRNAGYGRKQLMELISVEGITTIPPPVLLDGGFQVIAYSGDATGNGGYSSADATQALRVAVGLDSGFSAFPLVDPALIGDVNNNGSVTATDATRILQEAIGIDQPQIPPLPPDPPTIVPAGPDPLLSLPKFTRARPGQRITLPINLDRPDGLHAVDLALSFDPRQLEVVTVQRGRVTRDFDVFAVNVDSLAGTIQVGLGRTAGPISARSGGSVLTITFLVKADAPAGLAVVNLRQALGPTTTQLNEGGLDLNPDPSDEAGDTLDGVIAVVRRDRVIDLVAAAIRSSPTNRRRR